MRKNGRSMARYLLVGLVCSIAVLWIGGSCGPTHPDTELTRAVRQALEMAEGAREDAKTARTTATVVRALALMVGTATPLVVAYLVYRLQSSKEPDVDEILEVLREADQVEIGEDRHRKMPTNRKSLPLEDPDRDKD